MMDMAHKAKKKATEPHPAKLGDRGRVVIPAAVRKKLAITAGDELFFLVEGDSVRLARAREQIRRGRGMPIPTADLRRINGRRGRGIGDRACPALARALALAVHRADRPWLGLEAGVEIPAIR